MPKPVKRFVLSYHSHNITGNTYATNDHVALEADLATLRSFNARIVSTDWVTRAHRARHWPGSGSVEVAITFDDGPRFDYADFAHRKWGPQKSFRRILNESAGMGADNASRACATSFVIASPDARAALERSPDCGVTDLTGWLGDDWWGASADGYPLAIGNHSWDHVHPAVGRVAQRDQLRGDFSRIADYKDADLQVRQASLYILSKLSDSRSLPFAYPYGQVSEYLCEEYFPKYEAIHRCSAAFSTAGSTIDPEDSVWALPRLVCGWHWRSTEELVGLLKE